MNRFNNLFLTYADFYLPVGKALSGVKSKNASLGIVNLPSGGPLAAAAPRWRLISDSWSDRFWKVNERPIRVENASFLPSSSFKQVISGSIRTYEKILKF